MLRIELREKLGYYVSQFYIQFGDISCKRVRSDNSYEIDPSMYVGSAGGLFALHKYFLLFREENDEARYKLTPVISEKELDEAI